MRQLLLISLMWYGMSTTSMASSAALFDLNEAEMQEQFKKLDQLEAYLSAHEGITLTAMLDEEDAEATPTAAQQLLQQARLDNIFGGGYKVWGLPSFWWGFIGGFLGTGASWICLPTCVVTLSGIAIVAVVTYKKPEFKDEVLKSGLGCLVGVIVGGSFGLIMNNIFQISTSVL